jgi:hypothetical protein
MGSKNHANHGRDHLPNGSDPIPTYVVLEIKVIDDASVITVGDGKFIFAISEDLNGASFTAAEAYITDASSSGLPTVQIRNVTDSVDVLSTRVTIDVGEFTSYTAVTRSVVNTANAILATGDLIAIDVDVAGTVAMGLGVILTVRS